MNSKILFLLILVLILLLPTVSAGNNTTTVINPTSDYTVGEEITAITGGDSNISFEESYNGYCVEYGEHSAEKGDKFTITNLPNSFEYNCLKVFFTYYYDESQKDVISTQHMIWKFTNNKEFSRFNETLYEDIVDTATEYHLNDTGKLKYNETHYLVYKFKLFIAEFKEYQNYLGYNIHFEKIITTNNTSNNTNINDKNNTYEKEDINNTSIKNNTKSTGKKYHNNTIYTPNKRCGNPLLLLIATLTGIILTSKKE